MKNSQSRAHTPESASCQRRKPVMRPAKMPDSRPDPQTGAAVEFAWPGKKTARIFPVFLPYLGCPKRCVFCAQDRQTGCAPPTGVAIVESVLAECETGLRMQAQKRRASPQLAFYGGTFTALPAPIWRKCLEFARVMRQEGLISGFRCSTRPDSLSRARLDELASAGGQLVELGVQSFSDMALAVSGRGYRSLQIRAACAMLKEYGLGPGIQLMPGLPGSQPGEFMEDVRIAIDLGAVCLRFYPCLVLAGSPLEDLWRAGHYTPWGLAQTLDNLSEAWLLAASHDIAVIRMGIAPQAGLADAILAGPSHPALGSRVMGLALLKAVKKHTSRRPFSLYVPAWLQGCLRGWQGDLAQAWDRLGLDSVFFWGKSHIRLEWVKREHPVRHPVQRNKFHEPDP